LIAETYLVSYYLTILLSVILVLPKTQATINLDFQLSPIE